MKVGGCGSEFFAKWKKAREGKIRSEQKGPGLTSPEKDEKQSLRNQGQFGDIKRGGVLRAGRKGCHRGCGI